MTAPQNPSALLSEKSTFSFGSAFAATYNVNFTYDQAVAELQKVADDTIAAVKKTASYSGTTGYSDAAQQAAVDELVAKKTAAINKALDNQLTALYEAKGTATEDSFNINAYATAIETAADNITIDMGLAASKAEITLLKAKVKADVEAIDLSVYSKEPAAGETKSNYEKASELVAKALTIIDNAKAYDQELPDASKNETINTDGNNAFVIYRLKLIYTPAVGLGTPSGKLYDGGQVFYTNFEDGLKAIPTEAKEVVEGNKLEYAKTKTLSKVLGQIAADRDSKIDALTSLIFSENQKAKPNTANIADWEEQIADIKAAYADAEEVVTYLVNDATKVEQLVAKTSSFMGSGTTWDDSSWKYTPGETFKDGSIHIDADYVADRTAGKGAADFSVATCEKRVELVAEAKENAEIAKAAIAIDGSTAVEVDAALADVIDDLYKGVSTDTRINNYNAYEYLFHYIEETLINGGVKGVVINGIKYDAINAWDASNYDAAKQDEVYDAQDAAIEAVREAATVAEANDAFLAAYEEFDAIITKDEHRKDFTYSTGANYKAYNDAKKELAAYAEAAKQYIVKIGTSAEYANYNTAADNIVAKYAGTGANDGRLYTKCFTADEIAAMLAEGKAAIDGIKTDKVLAEEAKAIEAEVAALPVQATAADKDAVFDAYDKVLDHNDYCDLVESGKTVNYVKITTLANLVKKAEYKALCDAVDAINKDGKVTLDEAEAVANLRDAWDAFDAFYSDYDNLAEVDSKVANALTKFEPTIWELEIKAVVNQIAKLSSEGYDAAAVRAARAAFEDLARDQQHEIRHYYYSTYNKLIDSEKMLAANVEALKITASSTAAKGSITVKWTVKGDTTGVEGWEIWKSTKKNSGFSKSFTQVASKKSYKNTKGLKKGTRYYYKVRAIAYVDGQKITSDWSNKAYRVAK